MPVHPHRLCFTRTCPGLPGSLASHPVALRSFPRPRPARCASSSRRFRCCPRSAKDEGASNGYFGALCASLHHPLCTLHDLRCRMPCNTRFRLADCAFTGRESNPLACDERFLAHRFPLSRACPGAIAASDGRLFHAPDTRRLEARRRRYQRMVARRRRTRTQLVRTTRRIAMARRDWHHQVSRRIAEGAHTVAIEDLKVKAMTARARGAADEPGTNVRAKAGLNRVVLDTGWAALRAMLDDKAGRVIAVDPRHTSQTCAACGHVDARSRRTRDRFHCVACGHADHADANAARTIQRRGLALLHGEAARVPGRGTVNTQARMAACAGMLSLQVPISKSAHASQLLPTFGDMPLDEIGRKEVVAWFDRYGRAAPDGANRALDALRQILGHAEVADNAPTTTRTDLAGRANR